MTVKEALDTIAYNADCRRKALRNNMDYYPTEDLDEACEKIYENYFTRISRVPKRDRVFFDL